MNLKIARVTSFALVLSALTCGAPAAAEAPAPAAPELEQLLTKFLDGASRSDPAVHEWFWADDLVYTSSSGRRMGKADLLQDLKSAPRRPDEPVTRYTAEVRIQQYGDVAVAALRLVSRTVTTDVVKEGGGTTIRHYLNTGPFRISGPEATLGTRRGRRTSSAPDRHLGPPGHHSRPSRPK